MATVHRSDDAPVRYFALILGIVYLIVGVLGFLPAMLQPPGPGAPALGVDAGYGRLLGLFPVNVLHNVVHLGVGLWGLLAYRSLGGSIGFARGLAIFYGLLAVMGLIGGLNTTLSPSSVMMSGCMPLRRLLLPTSALCGGITSTTTAT